MSYEPGKMGVAEGTALAFTLTFTSVFLSIWSSLLQLVTTTAWLVPLISLVSYMTAFMSLLFVMQRVPGDLYEVSARLLGKTGAAVIALYLIFAFFLDAVIMLRQFAENTLLTAIPNIDIHIILGWYALVSALAIYIGIEPLARAAFIVLPFGIAGLTILLLSLYNKFELYNLQPWSGSGLPALLKASVLSSGFYLGGFLLPVLAPAFQNIKTIRTAGVLGLGLSASLQTVTFFCYTGIFSVAVGREKVLPFFEMARLVYINRFLQRIESFFIILWVIFGVAAIAIKMYAALYLLTRIFNLPSMRPLILPLAIISIQLALLPSDIATTIELDFKVSTTIFTAGIFLIPGILLPIALIKGKKKAKSCAGH